MVLTVYSFLFLVTALISLITAYLAWKRRGVLGAKELSLLMIFVTFWSLMVFLEAIASTVENKVLLSKISYIAVVSVPVLYLIFVQRFTGIKPYNGFRKIVPLFILPVVVLILAWTNESHHLVWTGFSDIHPDSKLILYHHGIGFYIGYLFYSYFLLVLATFSLIKFILSHGKTFRTQGWILLLGTICPWVASAFYLLGINITEGFDLTPGSLCISGLLFIFAILNLQFLDLVPIAREALLENLQEGILVLDNRNRVQDINVAAKALLGIQGEVLLGMDISQIGITIPYLLDALLAKDTNATFEADLGYCLKTYTINDIKLKTKPESHLIVIRDISELIDKQKAIQKSGEEYRSLYKLFRLMADNMPDMLWAKDLDKKFIFVNKAICSTYLKADDTEEPIGKTKELFLKREMDKYPGNPDWHNIGRYSANSDDIILETGKPGVFDEFGNMDGKFCFLDVRKSPIVDENGKMVGIVGSARDVTLQKKSEVELIAAKERAEESDRLKSAFLANMSHEIRTPMNSILGFLSLMQETGASPSEQLEYFNVVKKGGERLMKTINDIIDISRIDSGQMQLNYSDTNVDEMNHIVLSLFQQEAQSKNLELIFLGMEPTENLLIQSDRNKFFAVLSNLIKNAIKYTKKGTISFGCTYDEDYLRYYVKDTGIGIPKGRHKDIFERFVQVDGSNTRDFEGSGLGLSLCKAYLEMMGGSIWLESVEGDGSTFFFQIPLKPNAKEDDLKGLDEIKTSGSRERCLNILIVEDDPGSYQYLSLILKRVNHQVSHTYTGFEAIELCRQRNKYDLILMDVKLPGIDGYETTRRIREFDSDIQIIAVSAFAFTEDHQRALKAGCNDYITKPVNKDVLLNRIDKLI
jgi:signal transduction histidine kinase/CheY-like chemotaxis protein